MTLSLALALSALGAEGPVEVHGYAKSVVEVGLKEGELSALARLQQDWTGGSDQVDFRAAFDVDVDLAVVAAADLGDRSAGLELVPIELKTGLHKGWYDLVFGKQYVLWGQTDWVNPTDLFTPWDYAHMSSELEDYRVAPWAMRFTGWHQATSVDLVWVPLPMPHAMDFSDMEEAGLTVADPSLPKRTVANGDLGLRVATNAAGFDLSAMAFTGLDKRPGMRTRMDLSVMPPVVEMIPTYKTMQAVGADLVRGFGPVLFKAEGAYYHTADNTGERLPIRNREIAAVAGLTFVPVSSLNFSVQGTANHLLQYDPDVESAALATMGDPDPQVDPRTAWGMVERGAYTYKDTVSLQIVGVQGIPDGNHFEMLYLSWRVADGFTVLGGAILFGGPEESGFGRMKDYSRAFGEAKYSF